MKSDSHTWNYIHQKILFWQWILDNYPDISATAQHHLDKFTSMMQGHNRPGFIGILGVAPHYELIASVAPFGGVAKFIQGLLMFLFIINLGVGIVNLLPVKPLDGGKMWDIVLKRYVPKHSGVIMKVLGFLILALLIANFLPIGALF